MTRDPIADALSRMPERRRSILRRITHGDPDKAIARDLGMTPDAVKSQVRLMFKAVGARNRAHLVARVLHHRHLFDPAVPRPPALRTDLSAMAADAVDDAAAALGAMGDLGGALYPLGIGLLSDDARDLLTGVRPVCARYGVDPTDPRARRRMAAGLLLRIEAGVAAAAAIDAEAAAPARAAE
jgi:DNA-binding CsgD family transcriptional regulator